MPDVSAVRHLAMRRGDKKISRRSDAARNGLITTTTNGQSAEQRLADWVALWLGGWPTDGLTEWLGRQLATSYKPWRCPIIGSPLPQKVSRQKSARPGGWAERIFAVKLSADGDFYWEGDDPIMGKLYGAGGDILVRGRHMKSVIIFLRADFLRGNILMWHRRPNVSPSVVAITNSMQFDA